jgi:hypothetical protein
MTSSNPLTANIFKYRERPAGRLMPEGAFAWYHPGGVPLNADGWRQALLERRAENVWFSWWADWREVCRTEGQWSTYDCRHLSAEGLRQEIAHMQQLGLHVYLYFRQFLVEEGTYDDKPPYKAWLGRDPNGQRQPFIDFPVPKPAETDGVDTIRWTMADFGNPQFRQWYTDMVKRCLDYYRPDGIAWDMGYGNLYSRAAPELGIGAGTVCVQAEIWDYIQEKYPDMRVASNECFTGPLGNFSDSVLIEGAWDVSQKSELDYQAARAYDVTVFSLQLADDYAIQAAPKIPLDGCRAIALRARGENLAQVHVLDNAVNLLDAGFKADGQWHWIRLPKGDAPHLLIPTIQFHGTATGNSVLEISDLILSETDFDPMQTVKPPTGRVLIDNATPAGDFVYFAKWNHGNAQPTRVEKTPEGVRFSCDAPLGVVNKWWQFTTLRDKIIFLNKKVMALGAICSDAQLPALKELNDFSARLAAMRHVSEHKVIYGNPAGVYGTFWSRDGAAAGVLFNENDHEQACTITVHLEYVPHHEGLADESRKVCRVGDDGVPVPDNGKFAIRTEGNRMEGRGGFAPHELLVLRSWLPCKA